ncbi:hypothetical protein L210DRAFT_3392554 [Boletus edulis BED1]|uniref:Guanine nucleotide-binding protein-like 1 n=1 Tax=Boletus edulis BED1 TaxID=1328754 RepID=A0AAD4GI71_BOLED|nr:hypothetical protein L210DRAFT_3392554 [Boletus edulis BED1]
MAPLSGKQRKAQLKLKRAIKRGDVPPPPVQSQKRKKRAPGARNPPDKPSRNARDLQSEFIKLDKAFLDDTKALAGSIVLRRPILADVAVLRHGWISPSPPGSQLPQVALPKRPKWRYQMSKEELDANEQAHFRTWLAQQDAIIEQWQRALNCPPSAYPTADLAGNHVDDSETRLMPHPPTHFERNIEVWRQFWRVTEISQILLVLLDSRCPPLHLPSSLSAYLNIPTSSPSNDSSPRSKQTKSKAPHIILVLTKADISGPARTASWTSFLNTSYPGVPVVPVEAYAPKSSLTVEQGPTRYEPHLPGTFRERLVDTLRAVHEQKLQPPQWVTAPRTGESEEERLLRIDQWRPRVKRVIDWDDVLAAKGNRVGKAVAGAPVPRGQDKQETEGTETDEEDDEPEFLTIGVIGQPNVGKSSLLNAIFGKIRVRASRTPGKTKHFQTLFWTSDVRLVDCPGLVMPSFVPMDIQVLSGVLPISRISAVPFCIHQLARLLPLEQILELTHPSSSVSAASAMRTWRPGQRPLEQTNIQSKAPRWTASDIMTAYADKKGWVTAKAGRPDIHRAGNASGYRLTLPENRFDRAMSICVVLRLVAEGKIPWAFWPPGSSVSTDDGIWARDGVQQHARDDLETDEEEESEMGELSSEAEDIKVASSESDESRTRMRKSLLCLEGILEGLGH